MKVDEVPIGSVAKVQSGFAFKSRDFQSSGVRLLRNANILPGQVYWDNLVCLPVGRKDDHADYHLYVGDVLISLDRPIISSGIKVAKVSAEDLPAMLVQRVGRFRIDNTAIDPDYLYAFLLSPRFVQTVSGHEQSLGVPHISPSQIEAVRIPLPALHAQRQISTQLKAQLAEVENARQAAATQLSETTQLADAIIQESIDRGTTETHLLGEVLNEVKKGIGKGWADYPVLGATRDGLAPARELPGKHPQKYKPVTPGTVFYNPMRILIGSIAFVDDGDPTGITSPDYVVLQGKPGVVDSRWFYYWLRSPLGERCILSLARGAVRERMLFNRLADGEIELPDYATQQRASQALAELKPMRRAMEQTLSEINLMPERILAQAFASPSGGGLS
jgi:type I restriction enzyme S subunit